MNNNIEPEAETKELTDMDLALILAGLRAISTLKAENILTKIILLINKQAKDNQVNLTAITN